MTHSGVCATFGQSALPVTILRSLFGAADLPPRTAADFKCWVGLAIDQDDEYRILPGHYLTAEEALDRAEYLR